MPDKLSEKELEEELKAAMAKIKVNAKYRHYKGHEYLVTGIGFLEANDELCVIYKAAYNEQLTFIRPVSVWLETVEHGGRTIERFRLVQQ